MSLTHSLRRTAVGVAATAMLVGGALGFVSVAGTAGAEINAAADVATTLPANGIALNNATASSGTPCPTDGFAYWHFILAPNNNTLSFTSITLNLGTETRTFSGAQLVPNGTQTDNVFVGVPAGFTLTSIVLDGSYAIYGGSGSATNFTLSHVCAGTIPTTSTTSSSTTSSSTTSSSTTSSSTTSTTEAPTTSTTDTSVAPSSTAAPTTAATVQVLGTVQTVRDDAAAAVTTEGALPYTGTDTAGLVIAGLSILLGGLLLVGLARTKARTAQQ